MAYKILVADDEKDIRSVLRLYLEDAGYEVDGYSSWDDNVCVFASPDLLSRRVAVSGANPDDDVMEYSDQARRQLVITNVEFLEFNFGVFNG